MSFPRRGFLWLFSWIAVSICDAVAADSVAVFNEIQYHPPTALQTEWIELHSLQAVDVDISGWRIDGGVDYTFPAGTILPGRGYLVIAAIPSQIPGALGPWTGALDNGGDTLRIRNLNGRIMDELNYDDEGDWPVGPDGSGATLARIAESAASSPAAWRTSQQLGGTPKAANFAPPEFSPTFLFNEIAAAPDPNFFIELKNQTVSAASTNGWLLKTSTGEEFPLPNLTVPPSGFAVFSATELGLEPVDGLALFLIAADGLSFADAREITSRPRALTPDAHWGHPASATPGAENLFLISDAVVINEIFYHAPGASAEQWIELHNRSNATVDVSGWKFSDGISYQFPAGTTIAADGFLVVAWDPAAFGGLHPGVSARGPWSGSLSGNGELLTLRDAEDNIVDQLRYAANGRWSIWADGGGSSLELRDPFADNAIAEAWDASDESAHSTWENISYTAAGTNVGNDPILWNEFVMGLLAAGECLIDDVSVREDPAATNRELIQNGTFDDGTAATWRIIGTHRTSSVVDDPAAPGSKVLKLVATGTTEHMNNHAETTFKSGGSLVTINPTKQYQISFRAKWLRGSNRLHTRLYFNRLARQTLLNMPATGGTPGAPNNRREANIGPTFRDLAHSPVVPPANQSATVSVTVDDPDGVANVQLFTAINGGSFTSTVVSGSAGIYTATIPAQVSGALVQFYIQATDSRGAISFFPAAGPNARAMIPWNDGRAQLTLGTGARPHNVRIVIPRADATEMYKLENVMSNEERPCTVILDESEVYYQAAVRLKSSEHGRYQENRVGYKLSFGEDQPFLGAHEDISLDRSGGVITGQREILSKAVSNVAGGIYSTEDDIARVIPPTAPSGAGIAYDGVEVLGAAILSKTRFDDEYLDNQWPDGGSGPMFKYELHYPLTQTIDPVTRVVGTQPENPKVPQDSTGPTGVAVTGLGANKELYRWHWLIRNGRSADDYAPLISAVTAVGQSTGSVAFRTQTEQLIEINTWLRACVPAILFGVIDNYLGDGAQHNALLYFPPGGKAVLIPWDLDFLNQGNPQTPLTAGGNLAKWLAIPVNKRAYYGHMLDVLNRSFNNTFLTKWATHYSRFGTDNMTTSLSYLNSRATYARNVINGTGGQTAPILVVPFGITTTGPLSVSAPFATIVGDGWIDVAEIRLGNSTEPLAVTWTDQDSWTLQLPVNAGTATYVLNAFNPTGASVGTASIVIEGTGGVFPATAASLVVSELNYNPVGAGDDTEFIELLNISPATLELGGSHFDEELGQGIAYTFPAGVQMAPGTRLLVVRNRAAFSAVYPTAGPLAPGQFTGALDNSGETIVLYGADGAVIFRFTYTDSVPGTDGEGRTLVRMLPATHPDQNSYAWRASIANDGNPGSSDATPFTGIALADLDGDGIPALMEYYFGTSDAVPSLENGLLSRNAAGEWLYTFTHVANADDAVTVIEATVDPGGPWATAPATLVSASTLGLLRTETWKLVPPAGAETFFARLRLTLP